MKRFVFFIVLLSFILQSCRNNNIKLVKEEATVMSIDGYTITNLVIDDDVSHGLYRLYLKHGYKGKDFINLNKIDSSYFILFGIKEVPIDVSSFRLVPNTKYIIYNQSDPHAYCNSVEFSTDSLGNVK